MRVAIALHVGGEQCLPELLKDIANVKAIVKDMVLYVNLVEGKVDEEKCRELITTPFPDAVVSVTENRGMDIGGFLSSLEKIFAEKEEPFDYILKLHTKSAIGWRRSLIHPLCGNPSQVKLCLQVFSTQKKVGMIGASFHLYREGRFRKPNAFYLQQLSSTLSVPYTETQFIGGTMFWIRVDVLRKGFEGHSLAALRLTLNTPSTFDPHWYMVNYRDRSIKSVEDASLHWEEKGKEEGRYKNCLDARERKAAYYVSDGMMEHAYERLFGLMVKGQGLTVTGF